MAWNDIRRYGTGVGIELRGDDLRLVAAKIRPSGFTALACETIADTRNRPAADWGAEYARLLKRHGLGHVAAAVCLPRHDVILRQVQLPPVASKEIASAIRYQLDGLHPYGDEPVRFASAPLGGGRHLVAIALEETIETYADWLGEAGVAVAAFTTGPAALHAALRVRSDAPPRPLLIGDLRESRLEVYGESEGRPLLSAEMNLRTVGVDRAIDLALADLRVEPEAEVALALTGELPLDEGGNPISPATLTNRATTPLAELLPPSGSDGVDLDWSAELIAGATAVEAACPRLGLRANMLPEERRQSDSRWRWAPTTALAAMLAAIGIGFIVRPAIQDRAYAAELETRISRLDDVLAEAEAVRARTYETRRKLATLERLENRTAADLRILRELSEALPDQTWSTSLEIDDELVRIAGETDSAAPLLGVVNGLQSLEGAAFATSLRKIETGEAFQITARKAVGPTPAPPVEQASSMPQQPAGGMLETLGEEAAQ